MRGLILRNYFEDSKNEFIIPLGKAKIISEGDDVTLISFSLLVNKCIEAAEILKKDNINCEIIDLRTIRPLDKQPSFFGLFPGNEANEQDIIDFYKNNLGMVG